MVQRRTTVHSGPVAVLPPSGGGGKRPPDESKLPKGHEIEYHGVDWESIEAYYDALRRSEKSFERLSGTRKTTAPKQSSPPTANPLEELITARLRERYPQANPTVLGHLVKAKLILMDRSYVESKLRGLQTEMERRGLDLDEVLSATEQQQGFNPRQVVRDLLSRDQFRDILLNMHQMFDIGTPSDHGPHTHRLQWYVLYQAHADGRLPFPPVYLYGLMGTQAFVQSSSPTRSIWDEVFDFDQDSASIIGAQHLQPDEQRQTAAYSSPEWTLANLTTGGPLQGGKLERQLRSDRSLMSTFRGEALLDPSGAVIDAIVGKWVLAGRIQGDDFSILRAQLELVGRSMEELLEIYRSLQNKN